MNLLRMTYKEFVRHWMNFALATLSVVAVAACLGGVATSLVGYERWAQAVLKSDYEKLEADMKEMEDDYRVITKNMGFNILILPKEQDLSEFYAESYASKLMPEEYVYKLANSGIVTIQHLLPSLQQKAMWPEMKRTILLTGVRDEVPIKLADPKTPIQQPVPKGGIILGYELHSSSGLKTGDTVNLMGRNFKLAEGYEARGSIDDITAWIDLDVAQEMLGMEGKINGILALECGCAWADLPKVRSELEKILPDTQVIEKRSQALARAEARLRAAETAKAEIERAAATRASLQAQRESLAAVLMTLVIVLACIWIGFLSWSNVRERRTEIGILRAMGLRGRQIMLLFLGRAAFIGLMGGAAGYLLGWGVGYVWTHAVGQTASAADALGNLFDPVLFLSAALCAPIVAAIAGWIPAQIAAMQDPAEILRGE